MSKELEAFRSLMERLSNNVTLSEWELCNKDMQTVEDFIEKTLERNEPILEKLKIIGMLVDKKRFNTDDIELLRSSIIEVLEREENND